MQAQAAATTDLYTRMHGLHHLFCILGPKLGGPQVVPIPKMDCKSSHETGCLLPCFPSFAHLLVVHMCSFLVEATEFQCKEDAITQIVFTPMRL